MDQRIRPRERVPRRVAPWLTGRLRAEADWARAFVDRLERGEYRTADSPELSPELSSQGVEGSARR